MDLDFGDLIVSINARVKRLQPPKMVWGFGPFNEKNPNNDSNLNPIENSNLQAVNTSRKVDVIVDLKADQKVSFSLQATDEAGNPAEFDGTVTFSVDDAALLNLTDNGDGSGEVSAAGTLGETMLRGQATRNSDGQTFSGVAAVAVVAGDAETFQFTFGTPEESTPDTV